VSQRKIRLHPEVSPQFLADIALYEQRNEGTDGGAVEPCGHLAQALIDVVRIKVVVELRVNEVRDDMQLRVDSGWGEAGVSRRDTDPG
jgi:hypothetical protein